MKLLSVDALGAQLGARGALLCALCLCAATAGRAQAC